MLDGFTCGMHGDRGWTCHSAALLCAPEGWVGQGEAVDEIGEARGFGCLDMRVARPQVEALETPPVVGERLPLASREELEGHRSQDQPGSREGSNPSAPIVSRRALLARADELSDQAFRCGVMHRASSKDKEPSGPTTHRAEPRRLRRAEDLQPMALSSPRTAAPPPSKAHLPRRPYACRRRGRRSAPRHGSAAATRRRSEGPDRPPPGTSLRRLGRLAVPRSLKKASPVSAGAIATLTAGSTRESSRRRSWPVAPPVPVRRWLRRTRCKARRGLRRRRDARCTRTNALPRDLPLSQQERPGTALAFEDPMAALVGPTVAKPVAAEAPRRRGDEFDRVEPDSYWRGTSPGGSSSYAALRGSGVPSRAEG